MAQGTLMPPDMEQSAVLAADAMPGVLAGAEIDHRGKKSFLQLLNISIGFLGIQFAWAIQMGQMSPLLESLGSDPRLTSLIWAAGPVTGVLVQPIVGALSDASGNRFGRRRPFLLAGAALTAVALLLMPNSTSVLMAAILLWILDAAINLTQGPYRALVPDVVRKEQQATAYSLMSLTIGLGSVAAFMIGYAIDSIEKLFYIGATAMLAAMIWTIVTTPETPYEKPAAGDKADSAEGFFAEMFRSIGSMPKEGLKLCMAHSFTWFGLTCLFVFFSLYVPHQIFGAADTKSALYREGVQWGSLCYAALNAMCFAFSAMIGKFCARFSKKAVHSFGLLCMAASFTGMFFMHDKWQVMGAMALIGIGWATTLSVPFALLSEHLPKGKEGVMMGTFNIFIAAPGVLCTLFIGSVVQYFGNNDAVALVAGGIAIFISLLLLQLVQETPTEKADKLSSTTAVPA